MLATVATCAAAQSPYWCWDRDEVTAEVDGSTVTIHHKSALYNCCPESFVYKYVQQSDSILVNETEINPLCDCDCCTDLCYAIEDVPPGDYVIDFRWYDYEIRGERRQSVEVSVPDVGQGGAFRPGPAWASDCLTEPPVGVADPRSGAGLRLYPPQPNPASSATRIRFQMDEAGPVRLSVFGLGGALVRSLGPGWADAGAHAVTWDGRDDRGRDVPPGVYFCRLTAGRRVAQRTVILVR